MSTKTKKTKTNKELVIFFALTYFITSVCAALHKILGLDIFSISNFAFGPAILWFFMVFSPSLSAILLTAVFRGKVALKSLLKGYLRFNVKWHWYLAALALLLVPLGISFILSISGIGNGSGISPEFTFNVFLSWLVFNLFSGPFAEEAGWRGYALPRLQAKRNSFAASMILGILWILWHIPLIFVPGADQASFGLIGWIIYSVLILCISIILTWLYNNTKGSLVIVILAHYAFNLGGNMVVNIIGLVNSMFYNITGGISGILYLALIFGFFGYKRFSKLPDAELPIIQN